MAREKIITALDIGTTKICCLIGVVDVNNQVKICGIGENKSDGLYHGVIRNISTARESIEKAVRAAEKMANKYADNLIVGISGEHISSFDSHGVAKGSTSKRYSPEITNADVKEMIEDAKSVVPLPPDRKIIYAEPQYFSVDGLTNILDPIGMTGVRLEGDVHIVTADANSLDNIYKSVQLLGLSIKDIMPQAVASALAILDPDEKELGTILIDIGGGTTDISIFFKNSIRYTYIIPFGGETITEDLTVGLRTPLPEAEKIKIKYGNAYPQDIDESVIIEIPGIGGRPGSTRTNKFIAEIINPRIVEIANLVFNEIKKSKYFEMMTAGISLCGGTANLKNIDKIYEEVFNLPVKIGTPIFEGIYTNVELLSDPKYATVMGLLYWGKKVLYRDPLVDDLSKSSLERLLQKIKRWFATRDFT
ncbi:MAG: cell division protein FtsA [Candidatus Cloacimonadia bacterium]